MLARGKVPIVTGGSGLYIKALTHGLGDVPPANPTLRSKLAGLSPRQLQERLVENRSGGPNRFSESQAGPPRARDLAFSRVALLPKCGASGGKKRLRSGFRGLLLVRERAELQARIAENVRAMFERGVVAEVGEIKAIGATAAMAIGLRRNPGPSARGNQPGRSASPR